jgi:adenosylcobinamide kinase / adenosylcobinamide-phosphate guanylyltransferase
MSQGHGKLMLVMGGARSGKSDFALRLAQRRTGPVIFVATATADDAVMADRITAHRRSRPAEWETVEAPTGVASALQGRTGTAEAIIVDCLTLLTSNVLMKVAGELGEESREIIPMMRERMRAEIDGLVEVFQRSRADLIVVSNEVGEGIVPAFPLARAYRDMLGWSNTYLAARADAVYLLVAGLPVDVKRLAAETERELERG